MAAGLTAPRMSRATATAHVRLQGGAPQPGGKPDGVKPAQQQQQRWWDTNGWRWPVVLLGCVLLACFAQAAVQSIRPKIVLMRLPREPTLLEQQLAGCRTFKSQPIPYVDTSASLAVLDSHTPEQRQQAQQFTAAVGACTDFACLRKANELPRAPGQFRFPHFLVLGFPKCATTSIYCHLIQHPQVQHAQEKESHVLVNKCGGSLGSCAPEVQRDYIVEMLNLKEAAQAQMTKAAFDGSTHYAAEAEWLAAQLKEQLPWVKLVVSLRDPVSQALAMHLHNLAHNRTASCWDPTEQRAYQCVLESLEEVKRARYGPSLAAWMQHFPREQLLVVQHEALTSRVHMGGVLRRLKAFLGMHETLPSETLPLTNWKHKRGEEDAVGRYWNMTRSEYEHLVELARRNAYEVIKLLGQNGHANQTEKIAWARNWEMVWKMNLEENCEEGPEGNCKIVVS